MRCLLFWIMWAYCGYASAAQGQGRAVIAEHVPASAVLVLLSADIGQTCAEFRQTQLGQAFTGEVIQPLIAELHRQQRGGPLNLRPIVGFDWADLQQVHDPCGLCLFPVAENEPGWVCLFGGTPATGDIGPMAVAAKYFTQRGFERQTIQKPMASQTIFRPPASQQKESPRVLFVGRDYYGVANSPAAADVVLNVVAERSWAADSQRRPTTAEGTAASRPGDVRVMVRPLALWERLRTESPEAAREAADPPPRASAPDERDSLAASRRLGFDGVQLWVGSISFPAAGSLDWLISGHLVAPQPYDKALRLLALQAGPTPELPDGVAADITSFSFWRWNFPTALKGFGNLFDEANEPGSAGVGLFEDMLDGLRDDPEGVRVDLRREVFAELGPDLAVITDRRGSKLNSSPDGGRTLYMASVRRLPAVASALTRFYAGDERVTHVREHDYDVWTVPEGASLFVEGESDSVVSVRALALGENRMLFGTDEELLRQTLAGGASDDCLKTDTAWGHLWQQMDQVADNAGALWNLARLDEILAPGYERAITDEPADTTPTQRLGVVAELWRILLFGTTKSEAGVPLAAAPAFDRLRPALPLTGTVVSRAPDGWTLVIRALRSEE